VTAPAAAVARVEPVIVAGTLDRACYAAGVAVFPAMLLELFFLVPGRTSLAAALVFAALAIVRGGRIGLSMTFAAHLALVGYYLLLAIIQPTWSIRNVIRSELIQAGQVLLVVPLLASFLAQHPAWRARFVADVGRVVTVLGVAAALAGIAKLYLMTQGVLFESLYLDDGRYPIGTAMQHDYNYYALALVVALSFALWQRQSATWAVERFWCTVAAPILITAVMLSGSRRGFVLLALVLIGAVVAWVRDSAARRSRPRSKLATAAFIGLFAAGIWGARSVVGSVPGLSQFAEVSSATSRLADLADSDRLVSSRAPLIAWAVSSLEENTFIPSLIFGRGGRYLTEMGSVFDSPSGFEYPHNVVLSSMLHGGLVLTFAVLALFAHALRRAWRAGRASLPVLVALTATIIFAMSSSSSLFSNELLYGLLVGVSIPGVLTPITSSRTRPA